MKFVPDNWNPRPSDIEWAMEKFKISRSEADRQTEEFRDYEFKRHYTDFDRCLRNWFRTANKYDLLKREYSPRQVEEVSEEQRKIDAEKANQVLKAYKLRSVK